MAKLHEITATTLHNYTFFLPPNYLNPPKSIIATKPLNNNNKLKMLSCAPLYPLNLPLYYWASLTTFIYSQVNNWIEKKGKEKRHPRTTNNADKQSETELCQRWACRREGCVLCVILSSPDPTHTHLVSSYLPLSHTLCTCTAVVWLSGNNNCFAIFQCSIYTFIHFQLLHQRTSSCRCRRHRHPPVYTRSLASFGCSARHSRRSAPNEVSTENLHRITIMYLFTCTHSSAVFVWLAVLFLFGLQFWFCAADTMNTCFYEDSRFFSMLPLLFHLSMQRWGRMETIIKSRMHILHTFFRRSRRRILELSSRRVNKFSPWSVGVKIEKALGTSETRRGKWNIHSFSNELFLPTAFSADVDDSVEGIMYCETEVSSFYENSIANWTRQFVNSSRKREAKKEIYLCTTIGWSVRYLWGIHISPLSRLSWDGLQIAGKKKLEILLVLIIGLCLASMQKSFMLKNAF